MHRELNFKWPRRVEELKEILKKFQMQVTAIRFCGDETYTSNRKRLKTHQKYIYIQKKKVSTVERRDSCKFNLY